MIEKDFGIEVNRNKIRIALTDADLYITSLILGEYHRTVLRTLVKIYNFFTEKLKEGNELSEDLFDLLDDIILDIPSYSIYEKDRISKVILSYKKKIKQIFKVLNIGDDFQINLFSAIFREDLLNYRTILLNGIIILDGKYLCPHAIIQLTFNEVNNQLSFNQSFTCKEHEINFFREIQGNYSDEIKIIQDSINAKKVNITDVEKLILNYNEFYLTITSDSHIHSFKSKTCQNLLDIFIILMTSKDYTILTTNKKHFKVFGNLLQRHIDVI